MEIYEEDSPFEKHKQKILSFLSRENIIFLVLLLIFINLVYLDIVFLKGANIKTIEKIISAPASSSSSQVDNCSTSCVDEKIDAAISSLKLNNAITTAPTPTPTIEVIKTTSSNTSAAVSREYYVPFGSGSQSSTAWVDVSGLLASVDSNSYPTIKSVVFEVSLHIPTGNENASVRLYNATDSHPVWNSQVDFGGNTQSVLKVSQPIALDSGNKTYQVQIQTQLNYPAVIDQSRLHITTK